jgi:hypothetical protein
MKPKDRITKLLNLAADQNATMHERTLAEQHAERLIREHNVIHLGNHSRYHWKRYRYAARTGEGKYWRKADDRRLVQLWLQKVVVADIATGLGRTESQCYARIRNLKKAGRYQAVAAVSGLPVFEKLRWPNS